MKGLYIFKGWYSKKLSRFIDTAVRYNISPDFFTYLGIVAALFGGIALWRGYWLLAGVLIAVRLAGANLDGAVARARKRARPFGFVLNEIGDRAGDAFLFIGVLLYGMGSSEVILVLLALSLFTASLPTFISLSGSSIGVARINGGPFGKTERCLFLFLTVGFAEILKAKEIVLLVAAVIFILGSLLTAFYRIYLIKIALNRGEGGEA